MSKHGPDGTTRVRAEAAVNLLQDKNPDLKATLKDDAAITEAVFVAIQRLFEGDELLPKHLDNVGRLARAIAFEMGLGHEIAGQAYRGGKMHDVGKVDPEVYALISHDGKLDPIQKEGTELHTILGEMILLAFGASDKLCDIARSHHEFLNGTGYPDRLQAGGLPIALRIVTLADMIDAVLADRPGREGLSIPYLLDALRKHKGIKYEARAIDAFLRLLTRAGHAQATTNVKIAQVLADLSEVA